MLLTSLTNALPLGQVVLVSKHGGLTSTETIRLIRDGEKGGGGRGGGEGRRILYTYRYTVTTRMTPALRWASDESHFNVSLTVTNKVTRQCPQTTTFEEKREP